MAAFAKGAGSRAGRSEGRQRYFDAPAARDRSGGCQNCACNSRHILAMRPSPSISMSRRRDASNSRKAERSAGSSGAQAAMTMSSWSDVSAIRRGVDDMAGGPPYVGSTLQVPGPACARGFFFVLPPASRQAGQLKLSAGLLSEALGAAVPWGLPFTTPASGVRATSPPVVKGARQGVVWSR